MMTCCKKFVFTVFIIIFVCCSFVSAAYALQNNKTIKVAYPIQEGLTGFDENGNYYGYTYEYLQEIAQYTGWNYEFIQIPGDINTSLNTMMELVKSGEIDLMGGVLYNEELAKQYDYSGHSYGIVETVLLTLSNNTKNIIINSQVEQNIRIAVHPNAKMRLQELYDYCEMNLVTPELVYCETTEDRIQALKDGRADAILETSMSFVEGTEIIARFAPRPFYFITKTREDMGIMQNLNEALLNINMTDPYFETELYEKYFHSSQKLLFEDKELDYIQTSPILKVGILRDSPPFQYLDSNQEPNGISVKIFEYIAQATGLKFEMIFADSSKELNEMIHSGRIDIIANMPYDYEYAEHIDVSMTRTYVTTPYMQAVNRKTNNKGLNKKKLAATEDAEWEKSTHENTVIYQTLKQCIEAVSSGNADYTYADSYSVQYYASIPEYSDLVLIPQNYDPQKICAGIVKTNDARLLNILNKSILNIPDQDIQSIIYETSIYSGSFTLKNFILTNPVQAILIVSAFLMCIIGILVISRWKHETLNKEISIDLKKHLQLYELVNDYFFEYNYKKDSLMIFSPRKGEHDSEFTEYILSDMKENNLGIDQKSFYDILKLRSGVCELKLPFLGKQSQWIRIILKTVSDSEETPLYTIGKFTDIEDEKKEKEKLIDLAQKDSLTELFNAKTSRILIENSLKSLNETDSDALIMVDIDHFKYVNDHFGHFEGDVVLKKVAAALMTIFREDDIVARPGGDEFTIYVKHIRHPGILEKKCTDICRKINKITLNGDSAMSASVGAAVLCAGDTYETAYKKADAALYLAKEQGRNRFIIYSEETDTKQK